MARSSDKSLVEGAQQRALIVTFLSNHPGEHDAKAVAAGTKLSGQSCGQLLKHLAETGLIPKPRIDGTKRLYHWVGDAPTPEQLAHLPDVMAAKMAGPHPDSPPPRAKKPRVSSAKEVEIVINGTEIIVGRNPVTGRIRVVLEDVA